jgi:Flp pilus assembly pilin Flp
MTRLMKNFLRDESGTTAIEYCLLAAMFALAAIVAATALGQASSDLYLFIRDAIVDATT